MPAPELEHISCCILTLSESQPDLLDIHISFRSICQGFQDSNPSPCMCVFLVNFFFEPWKYLYKFYLFISVCEQAYSMAQNLDPSSDGRGVLQFKTGLMSAITVCLIFVLWLVLTDRGRMLLFLSSWMQRVTLLISLLTLLFFLNFILSFEEFTICCSKNLPEGTVPV
jgi:hypothetical protein